MQMVGDSCIEENLKTCEMNQQMLISKAHIHGMGFTPRNTLSPIGYHKFGMGTIPYECIEPLELGEMYFPRLRRHHILHDSRDFQSQEYHLRPSFWT